MIYKSEITAKDPGLDHDVSWTKGSPQMGIECPADTTFHTFLVPT